MSRIEAILETCAQAAEDPVAYALAHADGRGVVGCAPYFVPFELVDAAGMLPVELWGGDTATQEASRYYPAFYCSVALTILQKALDGSYDGIAGAIVPTTCDPLRNLEENWKFSPSGIPVMPLVQPVNRKVPAAELYYLEQLRRVAAWLEEIGGAHVTDKALREAVNARNRQRRAMRRLLASANEHLDVMTPAARHAVVKAAQVVPAGEHAALAEELAAELEARPAFAFPGRKLVATGILLDSPELLALLEENGFAIVGDDMPAGSKRFERDAAGNVDPFVTIARIWRDLEGCSMLFDPGKQRVDMLLGLVRRTGADGIFVNILKFCEEDEFDYPILKRRFEEAGVPILYLESEQQATAGQQAATRIQTFRELLEARG